MQLNSKQKILNSGYTFIQYTALILFILLSPILAKGIFWQSFEALGVILGIWSLASMSKSKLNISPAQGQRQY